MGEKEAGKICVNASLTFDWEIPDFFSRLKKNLRFKSPNFVFCDENWCLDIVPEPACEEPSPSPDTMALRLAKQDFSVTEHCVLYKVTIKEHDGEIHVCIDDIYNFVGSSGLSTIFYFNDYSEILRDPDQVVTDGTITISCTLRCRHHALEWPSMAASTGKHESSDEKSNKQMEKDCICTAKKEVIPDAIDPEKLLRDMEALFFNGKDSDVTLIVQDRKFLVHRSILQARSSVFQAMFSHDMAETISGVVTIKDFDPDVFRDFLLYLYSAKVKTFSQENVVGLYSAADKYNTQELKVKCVEFMTDNLSVDMFCSVVSLALEHQETALLEAAVKFFVDNFKEVLVTVEWLSFLKENPVAANELLIKVSDSYAVSKEK